MIATLKVIFQAVEECSTPTRETVRQVLRNNRQEEQEENLSSSGFELVSDDVSSNPNIIAG